MAQPWSIAIALGISLTSPSDLTIDMPAQKNHDTMHSVTWAGKPFVSPLYYVVRIGKGDVAIDFTHYKIEADTSATIHESGTWHGSPVDGETRLDARVQHIEISHGVNSLALIGLARRPDGRGAYAAAGPLIYLSHAESTVDGVVNQWGYAHSGNGFEILAGAGRSPAAPFAELKHDWGFITVGITQDGGTASVPLSTTHISVAP